jgi:murein DD-endopeptidase MepM/ murein hydrolase activator NlpD
VLGVIAACLIVLPGPVVEPFAPVGTYSGHWGVDVAVPEGAIVAAPLDGVVSFAGSVAGRPSVTIRADPFRVSLTYLREVMVVAGVTVRRGDPIGVAGTPHGRPGLHIGVRRGDRYVDPEDHARCAVGGTIRLLPPPILGLPGFKD